MFEFKGKKVLVTGASRGIGKAIAKGFAMNGAQVSLVYRKEKGLADNLRNSLPGENHICVRSDVSVSEEAQYAVSKTLDVFGSLDIVINNAGMYIDHPIADVNFDDWQDAWQSTINTNLIGPANICYHAAKHMIKQGGGKIINISSRGANRGEPVAPAYGASKSGLNSMSQSLAVALAPYNIFVGVVAPGFVDTDMASEFLSGEEGDAIRKQSPLGRVATSEEIAQAVLMLSMDGMEYATGTILDINGASYLRS